MKYIKLVVCKIDGKEATRRINANTFLKGNIGYEGVNDNNQLEWVSGDSFDLTEQSDRDTIDKIESEIVTTIGVLQYESSVEEELFVDTIGSLAQYL